MPCLRQYAAAATAAVLAWVAPGAHAGGELDLRRTEVVTVTGSVVHIANAGDGSGRLFVVEKEGRIRIVRGGVLASAPFLDISDRVDNGDEQGLLSVAFPPQFAQTRRFYVFYVARGGASVIARYRVTGADLDRADPASEQILLTYPHPFANHNGGQLAFGPDGYLYIGSGDGGSGGDPQNNGQRLDTLLGKILRIDADTADGTVRIPPDNPFASNASARPQIWAYGLRNPWRFSFDRANGDLYIADVGQGRIEEIDYQPAGSAGGQNYGWRIREGSLCFGPPGCTSTGLTPPINEYTHDNGNCSVTGGHVYRGALYPRMQGKYFFGDFCSGLVWTLQRNGETWTRRDVGSGYALLSTFGEDEAGELYAGDLAGKVWRLSDGPPIGVTIGPGFSGNWFDPTQDGHGLQLEVLAGNVVTVFWYTFDANARQAWFGGVGVAQGNRVELDVAQTLGGRFPPNFDPSAIQRVAWGHLAVTFDDCNNGRVDYTSSLSNFSSGSMRLVRVTQLAGTTCP